MRPLRLHIDHVAIDMADSARAHELEPVLRRALELLAGKLAQVPSARDPDALARALDVLRVESVRAESLLGPGGAARLADELFHRIQPGTGPGRAGAH